MNIEVWLWILLVMGAYNPRAYALYQQYDCDVFRTARAIRDGHIPLSDEEISRAKAIKNDRVHNLMEKCARNHIQIITIEDESYPPLLKEIDNPPIALFVTGDVSCLSSSASIAVVGPREATPYGLAMTRMICTSLARVGITIVSGLAVGIDTAAHTCALEQKSPTVGVLACGHFVNYPAASRDMKQKILQSGGAIISELLPETCVDSGYFEHRNRIISGLCRGVFVPEASAKSGALLTAAHAIEQNRDVFMIPPHDITDSRFTGVVPYLRDGAVPVFSYVDIVRYYLPYLNEELEHYETQ